MLFFSEVASLRAEQANAQEYRANQHMEAVETRRHVERGWVNPFPEAECSMGIFVCLQYREERAQDDGQCQALDEVFPVAVQQGVMRPGDGAARQQQDHGV